MTAFAEQAPRWRDASKRSEIRRNAGWNDRWDGLTPAAIVVALFTIVAMAAGGGGTTAPLSETLLEVAAAIFLIAWLLVCNSQASRRTPREVLWLAGLVIVLPLVQLLPLPPAVWHALPGRQTEIDALALIGYADTWMPWSIAPSRTLAALLSLGPPLAAMMMVSQLHRQERMWIIGAIGVMAIVSIMLGALQISAGRTGMWRLYGDYNLGFLNGFQANRNATADVLLIGLVAMPVIGRAVRGRIGESLTRGITIAACSALALACALTASRTGIMLIPLALAFAALIWRMRTMDLRFAGAGVALFLAGILGALFAASRNVTLGNILRRFTFEEEFRGELWTDTLPAIWRYFPFGSGMSTFRDAFLPGERLAVVDQTWPVRAHNDYLELLLEAGVFGAVLFALAVAVLVRLFLAARTSEHSSERRQVYFALATMAIIGLHSVVDYPLRSMALAHLMAVAAGLLAAIAEKNRLNDKELGEA